MGEDKGGHQLVLCWDSRSAQALTPLNTGEPNVALGSDLVQSHGKWFFFFFFFFFFFLNSVIVSIQPFRSCGYTAVHCPFCICSSFPYLQH